MAILLLLGACTGPARVPFSAVKRIGSAVELSVPRAELETNRLEAWTRDHLIGHLPGAGDAPECPGPSS